MKKLLLIILIIGGGWKFLNDTGSVSLGPGVMVAEAPLQQGIDRPVSFRVNDYTITELAEFEIKAKVLGKKNYRMDREADLSPVDLALGWGNMSDESVLKDIQISQSGRFYRWRVESFPIPRREIETYSANMHLIPSDDSVASAIDNVRQGDIIEISGSLVEVLSNDGWRWKSSQTRKDTGRGACELIWVEELRIVTPSVI